MIIDVIDLLGVPVRAGASGGPITAPPASSPSPSPVGNPARAVPGSRCPT